jgi:hypothetical protein
MYSLPYFNSYINFDGERETHSHRIEDNKQENLSNSTI